MSCRLSLDIAVCLQLITFQRKRANRRIVNEDELLALLRSYAPVHVVEFNSSHSFIEQISTLSRTGVFISVRSPTAAMPLFSLRSAAGCRCGVHRWPHGNASTRCVGLAAIVVLEGC